MPAAIPSSAPLLATVLALRPAADVAMVQPAYEVARRCHDGRRRFQWRPFLTRPVIARPRQA